jgi:sigma-E factor negative regulatory protein RseC
MKNAAYVKEVSGEKAVLKVKRECACGGKENCGAKCFTLAEETIEAEVYNSIGAKAGDYVEVEGKTSAVLTYASVVFLLPVFTGLLLYFLTDFFTGDNIILPYIISGGGFILSIFFLYYFLNNIVKKRNANDFKITKILNVNGEDYYGE